jgi:peptidoglycan/LPS O-acetylase OafA/YrhL
MTARRDRFAVNNFDFLRFIFASTVMLVHAHVLSQRPELAVLSAWLSSDVAVKAFFVVSGLLVVMSYERSRSVASYFEKRVRRIYPAYFFVVVAAALGLFAVSTLPASGYFGAGFFRYLAANLAFLNFVHPTLPGVFVGNVLQEVNGALWTLKIEVMFYVSVPVIAWLCRRIGRLTVLAALYVLSVAYVLVLNRLAVETGSPLYILLARQLPGQLSYFMVGAFFYYYFGLFEKRAGWFLAAAIALFLVDRVYPIPALEPLWLGTLVVYFGFFLYVGNFGRYGDFSYGIYILHFPIIQLLVQAGLFAVSPYLAVAVACATVVSGAVLLWHLVEKPFLKRGSHYVAVTARERELPESAAATSSEARSPAPRGMPESRPRALPDGDEPGSSGHR